MNTRIKSIMSSIERKNKERERWIELPTRIRRLSGLEEHLRRRSNSDMRSTEGTSSKLELAITVVVVTERESVGR